MEPVAREGQNRKLNAVREHRDERAEEP